MCYKTGELERDENEVTLSGSVSAKVFAQLKCFLSKASPLPNLSLTCSASALWNHNNASFIVFLKVI